MAPRSIEFEEETTRDLGSLYDLDELIHHGADAVEDLVGLAVVPEEPET